MKNKNLFKNLTKNNLFLIFIGIFIISDLTFSFIQYYNAPLQGDLAGHVLPDKLIQPLFDDPFGFQLLKTGEPHSNPNRFFAHWTVAMYFQYFPLWLQNFTNPINSIYLASAIAKLVIQVLFIYILAFFISGSKNPARKNFLLAAVIIVPLFQAYGYWSRMGIVDKSIVYTFFYALPLVLLMLFFLPVFNRLKKHSEIKTIHCFYMVPLIVILPLSGPLMPAVILIVSFFILLHFFIRAKKKNLVTILKSIPKSFYLLLIPINLWSLYSLFLGFYNTNYSGEMISLAERFSRLPEGILSQLFHSLGFPLMLLFIGMNTWFIKKMNNLEGNKLIHILIWIGIFALLYILLLPFGGYRPYRARIIRYDTFMPVTVALIWYFGASTYFLIHHFKRTIKQRYVAAVFLCLMVFTIADIKGIGRNRCERQAFEKMARAEENIIAIPKDCLVLAWHIENDYKQSVKKAELIYYWRITDKIILFSNEL
jgi:hypothetical protein